MTDATGETMSARPVKLSEADRILLQLELRSILRQTPPAQNVDVSDNLYRTIIIVLWAVLTALLLIQTLIALMPDVAQERLVLVVAIGLVMALSIVTFAARRRSATKLGAAREETRAVFSQLRQRLIEIEEQEEKWNGRDHFDKQARNSFQQRSTDRQSQRRDPIAELDKVFSEQNHSSRQTDRK